MIGTKNEHDEVHIVRDYVEWKEINNADTKNRNGASYYFPRLEYEIQKVHFLLSTTIVKVGERLGHLAIIITILGWFFGAFEPAVDQKSNGVE